MILVNKPLHWTSANVVAKIRNRVHAKTGHAGTLDPLATGLLILCTGKFTKRISEYMAKEKEYTGSFTLGATTASYDLETEPVHSKDFGHVTQAMLNETAGRFTGEIIQVPPVYSAIKKDGKRSYDLARQGKAVALDGRKVVISLFEMQIRQLPVVDFRVVCSTGTYIRSLAHLVISGELDLESLPDDDEEAIALLTRIKGIGRWSAEIYLLFAEGRADVFPAGDLAVMIEIGRLMGLPDKPSEKQLRELAEAWRPYRGAAAVLAWHSYNSDVL